MQFTTSVLIALAAATSVANPVTIGQRGNICGTGSLQCCNSVQSASSRGEDAIGTLLNGIDALVPLGFAGNVGVTCNPIAAAIGLTGNACSNQAACCRGNSIKGGLFTLDCEPLNVGL